MSDTEASEVQHGPLEERHRQLGASFAEFSGWLMPVSYAGTVLVSLTSEAPAGLWVCTAGAHIVVGRTAPPTGDNSPG